MARMSDAAVDALVGDVFGDGDAMAREGPVPGATVSERQRRRVCKIALRGATTRYRLRAILRTRSASRSALFEEPTTKARNGNLATTVREHAIRGDADFACHVDHIHFNPVKHGYVTRVCDWPYSSFHQYVKTGSLPADWGGDLGRIEGRFGERPTACAKSP